MIQRAIRRLREGRPAEAEAVMRFWMELQPQDTRALYLLATAQLRQGRLDAAHGSAAELLSLAPDMPEANLLLGVVLQRLNRMEEAVAPLRRAMTLQPNSASAAHHLAMALHMVDRNEEAFLAIRAALRLRPDMVISRYLESLVLLRLGVLPEAWTEYEARLRYAPLCPAAARHDAIPRWRGEGPIAGRTVLLHREQSSGDTIQFVRYAPMVTALGARVVLEVQPPLKPLLAGMPSVAEVFAVGESLPAADLQCPLLSLPLAFRTTIDTVPADLPYLRPDAARVEHWRERLGPADGPRIGIAWSGRPEHFNDANRSLPLARLAPLLSAGTGTFHVLQTMFRADDLAELLRWPRLQRHDTEIADFADLAALVSLMDVVIAADTSVAHLAGALGHATWLLGAHAPDWRWFTDRDGRPLWYPHVRVFRQPAFGDWDTVIARVAAAVSELAWSRGP
jgi:hypothetical protein